MEALLGYNVFRNSKPKVFLTKKLNTLILVQYGLKKPKTYQTLSKGLEIHKNRMGLNFEMQPKFRDFPKIRGLIFRATHFNLL